jgi:hypothetical protein
MMASLVAMTAIIFMMVFANSLGMLVAAQVLVSLRHLEKLHFLTSDRSVYLGESSKPSPRPMPLKSALSSCEAISRPMSTCVGA